MISERSTVSTLRWLWGEETDARVHALNSLGHQDSVGDQMKLGLYT